MNIFLRLHVETAVNAVGACRTRLMLMFAFHHYPSVVAIEMDDIGDISDISDIRDTIPEIHAHSPGRINPTCSVPAL